MSILTFAAGLLPHFARGRVNDAVAAAYRLTAGRAYPWTRAAFIFCNQINIFNY